jgi:maltose alpha-D-glucosyltransferase/alpha-amylase
VSAIGASERLAFGSSTVAFCPTSACPDLIGSLPPQATIRWLAEVKNGPVVLGERLVLRGSRRVVPGINPAVEMGRYLTEQAPEVHIAPAAGWIELREADGTIAVLALVQRYVEHQGEAWSYTQDYLERFLSQSLAGFTEGGRTDQDAHGGYCLLMETLGRRLAELHRALAVAHGDPAFEPEPVAADEPAAWARTVTEEVAATVQQLREGMDALSPEELATAGAILAGADDLVARLSSFGHPVGGLKIRIHGDFHLGQVLIVGSDVTLIGFGFEPTTGVEARRTKHSPVRDVAELLCSLGHAAVVAVNRLIAERADSVKVLEPLARDWQAAARTAFLTGYLEAIGDCPAWPAVPQEAQRLLALFSIERALRDASSALAAPRGAVLAPLLHLLSLVGPSDALEWGFPSRPQAAAPPTAP